MSPTEFRDIRGRLGLSAAALGHVLGYRGEHAGSQIRRLERGAQDISPQVERLMLMFDRHGVPDEFQK